MDTELTVLEKRLDDLGWGIFLMMIGILWLIPPGWAPQGAWLIGTGLLLLALNGARRSRGIPMNAFTTVLGIVALLAGLGEAIGVTVPFFAICLVLIGASLIARPFIARRA